MPLYTLKREYEQRRQALIDQLQKNPSLDPATQHQIYGAIKEIENFLKTIEYQIAVQQESGMSVELARPRPSPLLEKTKGAVYHVARGTKQVFTHHIPGAAKRVVAVPKRYFDKKKEEARLRQEIENEIRSRQHQAQLTHTTEHVVLEHPHQELAVEHEPAAPVIDETVQKEIEPKTINDRVKRERIVARPAKTRSHPSRNAPGKKGGQHKPHNKRDKYKR